MTGTDKDPFDPWGFMVRFYAVPGIAPACLRLQEAHGLDIPFFLALLHARVTGRVLDRDLVQRLDGECASWRDEVIRPLRAVRIRMKAHPWMTPHAPVPELRSAIKEQELRAERIEVEMLARRLADLPSAGPCHDPAELRDVARLVLDRQSPSRPEALPEDARFIAEAAAEFVAT
ncbi:TIGR02444 family protein [Rubellimicrobium arenae]|uniref:TIGR02444 family protein n=1 Tax=Rubellimicrobium arenae TaxID=2817372 RepID=UPI001B307D21|nr:TIGR02444 family protein [Rubellimicrobium arenae]